MLNRRRGRLKNRSYPYYDIPEIASIADMLETAARERPDFVAFRYRAGREGVAEKTCREVLEDVRRAACWIGRTYGRGRHIAVIGENSYEWLLAFFGALGSGNVAVPIDKELPAGEIADMIREADADVALVSSTYQDLTEGVEGLAVTTLKQLQRSEAEGWQDYGLFHPADDDLACIFFTSGTSGRSKGVMLSHGNLASDVSAGARVFSPEGGAALSVLPFHHAFGLVVTIMMGFHFRGTIFINRSLKRLKEDMLLAQPGIIPLVPLFVEVFYKQIRDGVQKSGKERTFRLGVKLSRCLLALGIDIRPRLFRQILEPFGGKLKYFISGGAYLDPFYVKFFRDIGVEIINGYGATECSPSLSINRNYHHRDGSAGLLMPGVEVKISPEGEVLARGPMVMKGYYKNPEETAKVLRDGWYATGDLGYMDADGFLFLTGRTKNLIILSNGENISPEELENDFNRDPGVREALVYEQYGMIVAEIYPEEDHLGDEAYFQALKQKVNQGRPAYKQVARIVLRDEDFVRNTTKKIVRYKNVPQNRQA